MILAKTSKEPVQRQATFMDRRPRRERRQEFLTLQRHKKKLTRKLRHILLDFEFTNDTVTAFANFHLFETFKQAIGFKEIIGDRLSLRKGKNSTFSAEDTMDYLIDSSALGCARFEHTESLRFDPGYKEIKQTNRFPSEKVFRDFIGCFTLAHLEELCEINQEMIRLSSQWHGAREVWFDIDATVITIFGSQEGGEIRYNPHYHGRPSYDLMACFLGGTNDLLYIELCAPGHTPKSQFITFFEKCQQLLPPNYVLKGVRLDKGFFSEKNIGYLEANYLEYVAKVPLYGNVDHYIKHLPEDEWSSVEEGVHLTRKKLLLDSWTHDRYIDIRRRKIEKQTDQIILPNAAFYRYEAILSSEIEHSPEENFRWYDQHATVEGNIKEIKEGFQVDQMSQHLRIRNFAFAFIKVIAYNLVNFFKRVALPFSVHNQEPMSWHVKTIRRKLLNLPGNILGRTRNRRVKLAANRYLERLLLMIKDNLNRFLWFVANDFQPVCVPGRPVDIR